jgi:hypothetical protein
MVNWFSNLIFNPFSLELAYFPHGTDKIKNPKIPGCLTDWETFG